MAKPVPEVERDLERRVEELGYELAHVEWAGSKHRPILRVRVDLRDGAVPEGRGEGVSVQDCAVVSRGLEPWLDGLDAMPDRYVLEVSSPGLNRPLMRSRDWGRFVGEQVAVKGSGLLEGRAKYLEGELLGCFDVAGDGEIVRLRLDGGDEVEIAREAILGAHLVHRWT